MTCLLPKAPPCVRRTCRAAHEGTGHPSLQWSAPVNDSNDGGLDLFVADWELSSRLYLNNNGNFTLFLSGSDKRSMGVVWGDYDNDGYLDLFLPSGGMERFSTRLPNMLHRNNRSGRLYRAPASAAGPVVKASESSIAANWSDLDGDGLLDLFVVNHGQPNSLFLNTADHQFVPVTKGSLEGCEHPNAWRLKRALHYRSPVNLRKTSQGELHEPRRPTRKYFDKSLGNGRRNDVEL